MPQVSRRRSSHFDPAISAHGWVDGAVDSSSQPTYSAPGIAPLQYGPLTAQDDCVSTIDWPRTTGLLTDDEHFSNTAPTDHAHVLPTHEVNQHDVGPWLHGADEPRLEPNGDYAIYGQMLEAQYQDPNFIEGHITHVEPPLLPGYSNSAVPQSNCSPYDGIWAFNPLAVDDNFVYPTIIPTSQDEGPIMAHGHADPCAQPPPVDPLIDAHSTEATPGYAVPPSLMSPPVAAPLDVPLRPYEITAHAYEDQTDEQFEPAETRRRLKPERTKKNRGTGSQAVVPKRQGPLSVAQRQKADDMRYYGACWRCRRYKKPVHGYGHFDQNSSADYHAGNAEQVIDNMTFGFEKVPNWKTLFGLRFDMAPLSVGAKTKDKYEALSIKLQATRMAGTGFIELLEILANYQRSRTKPDTCLELACSALNHICDIYHAFVKTDMPIQLNASELLNALTKFRTAYNDNWRHFLQLCLSGRRSAWFPAFLCACLNVPLLVVLKDGFTAIPEPARTTLWPNISFLIEDLRNRLYPMGLDLLGALAKGIKPWKLRCWGWREHTEADGTMTMERDPDGMRLLAGDIGAFDGFAAVQHWLAKNRVDMLDGVSFLTTPPFSERNAKMQPIAALAWIFEVTPPKEPEREPIGVETGKVVAPV